MDPTASCVDDALGLCQCNATGESPFDRWVYPPQDFCPAHFVAPPIPAPDALGMNRTFRRLLFVTGAFGVFTLVVFAFARYLRFWFTREETPPRSVHVDPPRKPSSLVVLLCSGRGSRRVQVPGTMILSQLLQMMKDFYPNEGYNQKDFTLHLLRPGENPIKLDHSKTLEEQQIQNNDKLELVRNNQTTVCLNINLHGDNVQVLKVEKAARPQEVVQTVCQQLDILNSEELSLCLTTSAGELEVMWLESNQSLEQQGVKDGDMLLFRKKFFVLNKDLEEAKTHVILLDILYHQCTLILIVGMRKRVDKFTQMKEMYIGGFGYNIASQEDHPRIAAYLHYLEQSDLDLSQATNMVPWQLRSEPGLLQEIRQIFQKEQVALMDRREVKVQIVNLLCKAIASGGYFKVESTTGAPLLLIITTTRLYLCEIEGGRVKTKNNWLISRIKTFTGTPTSFQFEMVYGKGGEVYTRRAVAIVKYLQGLVKQINALTTVKEPNQPPPHPPSSGGGHKEPLEGIEVDVKFVPSVHTPSPESPSEKDTESETDSEDDTKEDEETETEEEGEEQEKEKEKKKKEEEKKEEEGEEKEEEEEKHTNVDRESPQIVKKSPADEPSSTKNKTVRFPPNLPESPAKPRRLVRMNTFVGKEYQSLLLNYRLFHIVIMDQDMRAFMVNITQPASVLIEKLCTTFHITTPCEELCLCMPKGLDLVIKRSSKKEGSISGTLSGALNPQLINNMPVEQQYKFNVRPYILHLMRKDEVRDQCIALIDEDECEGIDEAAGREWPTDEIEGIAREREFYQSWMGIIQGDYPIEKHVAVELASLLVHVLIRCKERLGAGPIPSDFKGEVTKFLPPMHCKKRGIVKKVLQASEADEICKLDETEAKEMFVKKCNDQLTYEGIFFDVKVPEYTAHLLGVIPHKKMVHRLFGIDKEGIMDVDPVKGKVNFTHRYVDISEWKTDKSGKFFELDMQQWRSEGYIAQTNQAREIIEILKLYLNMTRRGQISQAPVSPILMSPK